MTGTLDRTTTSGRGKQQQVLPVFWSSGAYLLQPWLSEVVRLLTEGSFDFERDFFCRQTVASQPPPGAAPSTWMVE